ncbi:MAG: FTR1 family protein [Archaeoglobaceae archaeon]
MMGQLVITLREGFEAALLVAVLVAYLKRSGRVEEVRFAYYGTAAAILAGFAIAAAVILAYGGLQGEQKELFEGFASYLAVAVLTYMILWMAGRDVRGEVDRKAEVRFRWGIAAIAFVFVVREVIETVLFLAPFASADFTSTVTGAVAGIVAALVLAVLILKFEYRMSLRKFFYVTSVLLAFIAAGLLGYGTHEFVEVLEEKGLEHPIFEKAYSLGIDESHPLHHKGLIGGVLAVMFGYSASMEWIRLILQLGYLAAMLLLIQGAYARNR